MLEIFIPTEIKWYLEINKPSNNFLNIIKNDFKNLEISNFNSTFFEWIKIKSDKFLEDLIILCNWEFWEFFFIDFDPIKNSFNYLWTQIIWEKQIQNKIEKITKNISFIVWELNSKKLLTNTKKEKIKEKINQSLFSLSWIIFLLYKLKQKTTQNITELTDYKWKIDYESEASLLSEVSKTKQIELQAWIDKLEGRVELYIKALKQFIL